jgi:poly-gamma-glutamate capsule biosynthesis protein CapA/YwtB (metallophosphatase superfamily)
MARKPAKYKFKLTAVAFANKVARIVFALMTHGGEYVERPEEEGCRERNFAARRSGIEGDQEVM